MLKSCRFSCMKWFRGTHQFGIRQRLPSTAANNNNNNNERTLTRAVHRVHAAHLGGRGRVEERPAQVQESARGLHVLGRVGGVREESDVHGRAPPLSHRARQPEHLGAGRPRRHDGTRSRRRRRDGRVRAVQAQCALAAGDESRRHRRRGRRGGRRTVGRRAGGLCLVRGGRPSRGNRLDADVY